MPRWLADAQPGWFAHPRLVDRLEVLHVSRMLGALSDCPGDPLCAEYVRRVLAGAGHFADARAAVIRRGGRA